MTKGKEKMLNLETVFFSSFGICENDSCVFVAGQMTAANLLPHKYKTLQSIQSFSGSGRKEKHQVERLEQHCLSNFVICAHRRRTAKTNMFRMSRGWTRTLKSLSPLVRRVT